MCRGYLTFLPLDLAFLNLSLTLPAQLINQVSNLDMTEANATKSKLMIAELQRYIGALNS